MGVHQLYMSQRRPRGASRECSGLCEEELGQTGGSEVLRLLYPSAAQQRWEEPSCGHARAVCSGRHPPCFCLCQIHSPAAPGLMHGQRRQDGGGAPLPCRLPGVLPVAHPTASSDSAAECRLGLSGRPEPGLQSHPACSPYDQLLPHVAVFLVNCSVCPSSPGHCAHNEVDRASCLGTDKLIFLSAHPPLPLIPQLCLSELNHAWKVEE